MILYNRYFTKIIKSNISIRIRNNANNVFTQILNDLTYEEKVQIGVIVEQEEEEQVVLAEDIVEQATLTFYVIVRKFVENITLY